MKVFPDTVSNGRNRESGAGFFAFALFLRQRDERLGHEPSAA
ncbi:MAG: hypothetical protein ACN6O8_16845 [Achromobacter sp.]